MPVWDFACTNEDCSHVERDVASPRCNPDAVRPVHCGKPMDVDYRSYRQAVESFEAYTTTHIHPDGKPLYVRNSGDLKRLETEYGVKRVDDPGLMARNGEFVRKQAKRTYI